MQQSTLKKIIYFLLACIPLTLWTVSDGKWLDFLPNTTGDEGLFFPFISGKNLLFRCLVDVVFIAWLRLVHENKDYLFSTTKLTVSLAVFTAIIFIADIFGVNPTASLFSGFERMEGFVGLIHYFMYFLVLTSMLKTKEDWKSILPGFIVTNLLVGLYGFLQLFGSKNYFVHKILPETSSFFSQYFPIHQGGRIDSTLGNPAYFAILSVYFLFVSLYLLSRTKEKTYKVAFSFLVLANAYLLVYTATRSSVLGLCFGLVVAGSIFLFNGKKYLFEWIGVAVLIALFILAFFQKSGYALPLFYSVLGFVMVTTVKSLFVSKEKSKKIVASVFILVVASITLFTAMRKSEFVTSSIFLNRFANISVSDPTGNSRIMVWKMSYEGFKERPVLGWGQENFPYVFAKYHDPNMYAQEPWFDRSHNVFFDWLIAGGLLGLLAHLSLYFFAAYLTHKTKKFDLGEKSLIYGLLVAQFINNLFIFDNLASYLMFTMLLAYISSMYASGEKASYPEKMWSLREWVVPTIGLAVCVLTIYGTIIPYFANSSAIHGMQNYRGDVLEIMKEKREGFEGALTLGDVGKREIREQFVSSALLVLAVDERKFVPKQASNIVEEKNKWLTKIHELVSEDSKNNPNDLRVQELYGEFFLRIGDIEGAAPLLERAHELAPNRQRTAFSLMQLYLLQNKIHEAYLLSKETYQLAPSFEMARKIYLSLALREGETEFKEALSDVHSHGLTIVYPTSLSSEFAGLTDKKRQQLFIDALIAEYPDKKKDIVEEFKALSVKK